VEESALGPEFDRDPPEEKEPDEQNKDVPESIGHHVEPRRLDGHMIIDENRFVKGGIKPCYRSVRPAQDIGLWKLDLFELG
jgi:hypothetical protein